MAGAPVTEVFYDQDFGEARTRSALIRAIWQVKDDIAVDFAFVVYALTSIRPARSAPASPLLSRYADLRAENLYESDAAFATDRRFSRRWHRCAYLATLAHLIKPVALFEPLTIRGDLLK
jgi:hypothetical protein